MYFYEILNDIRMRKNGFMTKLSDFVLLTKITIFNFHSLSSKHFFIHEILQWVDFKIFKTKKAFDKYIILLSIRDIFIPKR